MLSIIAAFEVTVEAINHVNRDTRGPIELKAQLFDLGIRTPLQTTFLQQSIMKGVRFLKHSIDRNHLKGLNPGWQVGEVADLVMRFSLPGDETFEESVEAGEDLILIEVAEETIALAGDEDFGEDAASAGNEFPEG